MHLFKTPIVTAADDALWTAAAFAVPQGPVRPVLVISATLGNEGADEQQLKKMLEAGCKMEPGQYRIVQMELGEDIAWHCLRDLYQPRIVFLIGVVPVRLGISALFAFNSPNNYDERIWIPTLSIPELEKDPMLKKQLWNNGMHPVFIQKKFGIL